MGQKDTTNTFQGTNLKKEPLDLRPLKSKDRYCLENDISVSKADTPTPTTDQTRVEKPTGYSTAVSLLTMICDPGRRKSTGSALIPIMINRRLIRAVRLIHGRNRGPSTHDELKEYPQSKEGKSKR